MANVPSYASSETKKPDAPEWKAKSLLGRYEELAVIRQPFLDRARAASKLTIPSLLPPQGFTGSSPLYQPWQSVGARGTNNLGAKLLLALLPANTPFFRFAYSQMALDQLQTNGDLKSKFDEGLSKYEKELMTEIETGTIRLSSFEAMLHLIVAGNALCYLPAKGGMKTYHLDSFVVVRDGMGTVLEIITEEHLSKQTVPESMRNEVYDRCKDTEKTITLHTCVRREGNRFETWQEIKGIEVPASYGHYALDASPFIPLRWMKIDGQDYGRGHIESLMGDLKSTEGLTQAIVEGSAAAAKMLMLVKPNGVTKLKTVAEAPNCAIRSGDAADVTVVQSQKAIDLRIAREARTEMKGDLESSFLLTSSITRDAERVTAEEIRIRAAELEGALGGVYSLLAQEFQLPLVNRLIVQMIKQKRIKPLPKGIVKPTIVTGLEALSRGHDLQRLDLFLSGAQQQLGPETVAKYVNVSDYLTRRATALALDQKGLIRSAEEIAQADKQAQMQSMVSQLGPNGVKAMADVATKGISPNAPQLQAQQ